MSAPPQKSMASSQPLASSAAAAHPEKPSTEGAAAPNPADSQVTFKGVLIAFLVGSIALVFCYIIMTLVSDQGPQYFNADWPASPWRPTRLGGYTAPSTNSTLVAPPAPILCVTLSFAINWLAWIPAAILQTEKFYDLVGGLTYMTCVISSLAVAATRQSPLSVWSVLPAVMVAIWALRLAGFLFYRIHQSSRGDKRFDAIKVNPASFFIPWTLQAVWASVTSMAMAVQVDSAHAAGSYLIAPGQPGSLPAGSAYSGLHVFFDVMTVLGLLLWVCGFALEVVADVEKLFFSRNPANRGRFIQGGVWSWCRHPNYFGEITLWVGMFIFGFRAYRDAQWLVVLSPIQVATLLLFVSGLPQLEGGADEKWGHEPEYQRYKAEVHVMIPFAAKLPCCRSEPPLAANGVGAQHL